MKYVSLSLMALALGCAGKTPAFTTQQARDEIQRLITLHGEAKDRYVLVLQDLQQAEDCERANILSEEAVRLDKELSLPKELWDKLTVVKMELATAAKVCNAK